MDSLRIGTFTRSVILEVATATRSLAEAGIDVEEISVASSPSQFASLTAGEYDAIFTSPDNVLAYRFLPSNPLGKLLDVEIVAALDRGLGLSLGARAGIDNIPQLRGGRIGVDVPNSGFAFVAYALLARGGLAPGDYEVVTLGSTPKRAAALLAGECDATILNAGNELRVTDAGGTLLSRAPELGPYLGTVIARDRTSPRGEDVAKLGDILLSISQDIVAGRLDAHVVGAAMRVLGLSEPLARLHLECLKDPREGLIPSGVVDTESLRTLVALRQEYLPVPELDGIMDRVGEAVRPGALIG